ncbi:MAG: hypothetical protein R2941_02110 [Desulfobacterales bacterium]
MTSTAEKCIPCGILNENSGELHISPGSSHKTGDFIADTAYNMVE